MPKEYLPLKDGRIVEDDSGVIDPKDVDVVNYIKRKNPEVTYLRYAFERNWFRNILFYIGKQWIKYDRRRRSWVKPAMPEWMPLPVTNRFASTVDAMMSVIQKVQTKVIYAPADDNNDALATADVANAIVDICDEETDLPTVMEKLNKWLALVGNGFLIPYYDNDSKYGLVFIQSKRCTNCGHTDDPNRFENNTCPNCGNKDLPIIDAVDEAGQPVGNSYPRGKMGVECASPLEIYADIQTEDINKSPYIMWAKTYPVEVIKERWPDKAKNIKPEGIKTNLGQYYLASLAYATNTGDSEFGVSYGQGDKINLDRATVWSLWINPSASLPKGLFAVVCGDEVLEEPREFEYHDSDGNPMLNMIHVKFSKVPARLFAKTPADDLIYKQVQRNKLEAFIQLAVQRTANPAWLIPQTCGVQEVTGEPGELIRYTDAGFSAKPERIAGSEVPQSIFRWLEKIDNDFEELAATFDVIKGQVPQNIPTLGGLQLLEERGLSRFAGVIKNIERARVDLSRMFLNIWKEYVTEDRIRVIKGDNSRWIINKFNKAHLSGNIDIRAEAGSSNPRSEAFKQYVVGQLINAKLIDLTDIQTRVKIFQTFNAAEYATALDTDVKDALKEQDEFDNTLQTRLRPYIDNHEVHLSMHIKYAKSDDFLALSPSIQERWMAHIMEHRNAVMQLQQEAMLQQQQISAQPQQQGNAQQPMQQGGVQMLGNAT